MEAYGFDSTLTMGNQVNESILRSNREARIKSMNELKDKQNDLTLAKNAAGVSVQNADENQAKTIAETVAGQVGAKGKDIEATYKTVKSIPKVITDLTVPAEKYLLGGVSALVDGATGNLETARNLFKSDATLIKEGKGDLEIQLREAERTRKAAAGETSAVEDLSSYLKAGVAEGATVGEKVKGIGKLGVIGTGLTIGTGIMDTVDDISSGKIQGANTAEKVSNIADIAAGGLEAVGTALDLTGAAAPVGVALNLLGGVVSLAGGIADEVGEEKEKEAAAQQVKQAQTNVKQLPKPQLQSLQAVASTGAEVRSAK